MWFLEDRTIRSQNRGPVKANAWTSYQKTVDACAHVGLPLIELVDQILVLTAPGEHYAK